MAATDEQKAKAREAIAYAVAIAGSQLDLARKLTKYFADHSTGAPSKVGPSVVQMWLARSSMLDPKYWPAIEDVTASVVTRRHLRPDLFTGAAALESLVTPEQATAARELLERYNGRAA